MLQTLREQRPLVLGHSSSSQKKELIVRLAKPFFKCSLA